MANADFVTRITLQNQQFQNEIGECRREISRLKGAASGSSDSIGSLVSSLGKFAGISIGVGAVASGMLSIAKSSIAAYSKIEDLRISFQTMLGSASQAERLLSSIREYGANTPYDTEGLAKAAQTMLSYGMAANDIMPTLKQLGDIGMGSSEKLQSLSLAFAQMSASGKVMKQDLNQMINAGFNPLQVISKKTGESMGVLLDKVSKGQISINQIKEAFKDATSEGGQFYNMMNNMNGTLSGSLGALEDSFDGLKQAIGEFIAPAVITFANDLVKTFNDLADSIEKIKIQARGGLPKSSNNWYNQQTDKAVNYANGDKKKLQRGIDIETENLKRSKKREQQIQNRISDLLKEPTVVDKKEAESYDPNLGMPSPAFEQQQAKNKQLKSLRASLKTQQDISSRTQGRIDTYKAAMNQKQTIYDNSTAPTITTTTYNTKKEVAPEGSIARLKEILQQAEHEYEMAITDEERAAAQAKIAKAQYNLEYAQTPDYNTLNSQIAEKKYKNEGNSGSITASGFEPEIAFPDADTIDQIQESINKITFEPFLQQLREAREALEALGSVNIESMDSIINAFEGMSKISNQTAKGLGTAGSAAIMMGQALQTLGGQGAAAKAGLILSALGQIAVSFATALADAGKQSWITWLAFGISGMATMMSLISQIKSFSDGGILNGFNTHGDQMLARVNAGEMILNGSQQKNLFNMLNNKGAVGGNAMSGDVEFVISGSNLKGVLRNYDKKMSIL